MKNFIVFLLKYHYLKIVGRRNLQENISFIKGDLQVLLLFLHKNQHTNIIIILYFLFGKERYHEF